MIAIIAKNGMLGSEVVRYCMANALEFVAFSKDELDVTKEESVKILKQYRVKTIINCSAYTNVDLAESQCTIAEEINFIGAKNLADYAYTQNIKLVHVSTDYVFNGESMFPYRESDECEPVTVYGKTKLAGEQAIAKSGCEYLIIRTSWLFGHGSKNFVETMISLSEKKEINVVSDQVGSPTSCEDLTKAIFKLVNKKTTGIYHVSNSGSCSWYQFAQKIFEELGSNAKINACSSNEYPMIAKRPKYSVLDTTKLSAVYQMPPWQVALKKYIEER